MPRGPAAPNRHHSGHAWSFSGFLPSARLAGVVISIILLATAVRFASDAGSGPAVIARFQAVLFGSLAWLTAILSGAWALVMFTEIVGAYRKISGFPWTASVSFAAAAMTCILALRACLS